MTRRRGFLAVALLCIALGALAGSRPLGAQEALPSKPPIADSLTWSFRGSLMIFPEENGPKQGAPTPLLPSPGAALAYRLWGPLEAELSLDLYFTHYGYNWTLDRPEPIEIENRSAFVLGALTGLQLGGHFPLKGIAGDRTSLRLYAGPAADLRIVLIAADLNEADLVKDDPAAAPMQTDAVREYFWSEGRWFLPFVGAGFDFAVNDAVYAGIDFRVWFPVYRLWTGENLPALEGWRFGPAFRITLR
ncbi:MAG: hypothetical protein LBT39_04345 [Treponema sp.]|jgi:hypothetical protein|nr:hypothetical protein [Treponema sp.]